MLCIFTLGGRGVVSATCALAHSRMCKFCALGQLESHGQSSRAEAKGMPARASEGLRRQQCRDGLTCRCIQQPRNVCGKGARWAVLFRSRRGRIYFPPGFRRANLAYRLCVRHIPPTTLSEVGLEMDGPTVVVPRLVSRFVCDIIPSVTKTKHPRRPSRAGSRLRARP